MSKNTVTWQPVTGRHQHRTHTSLPEAFHKESGCMFSRVRQSMWRHLQHTPKVSQNFAGEWNVVCIATGGTKTALGIIQVWFNYFTASFFKALGNINVNYLKIPKKHCGPHKRALQAKCSPRAVCLRPWTRPTLMCTKACCLHLTFSSPCFVSFLAIAFQHLSLNNKHGWLTRWLPWFFTNPIWQRWLNCSSWVACGSLNFCMQLFELSEKSYIFVFIFHFYCKV